MSVLKPLRVVIENFGSEDSVEVDVLNVPSDPSRGSHTATFAREVWIEETDFMESADKRFYRLTLDQGVGLRHTGRVITVKEIVRNSEGGIDHLRVESTPAKDAKKPRAYIHWVANPVQLEVNMYENLFLSERPDDPRSVPGGLL
ncbi:UNVERIFIED_CONTAM: hypothetical protein GTU68_031184, partial [Idotea baltica]|nr:hypothetical protein [Idotea baltica]